MMISVAAQMESSRFHRSNEDKNAIVKSMIDHKSIFADEVCLLAV